MRSFIVNDIYCSTTLHLYASFMEEGTHFRVFVTPASEVNFLGCHVLQYSIQWASIFPLNSTPLFVFLQDLVLSTVE